MTDLADTPRVGPGRGYIIPPAGRAALFNAAADAHRMAGIGSTQRGLIPDEDLEWYQAEPQRTLLHELYRTTSLNSQLNAIGEWLRALAGGD